MPQNFQEEMFPISPNWVTIDATDADASRLPSNTISYLDDNGNVNRMALVSREHSVAKRWRVMIGQALAEQLNYPEVGTDVFFFFTNCRCKFTCSVKKARIGY